VTFSDHGVSAVILDCGVCCAAARMANTDDNLLQDLDDSPLPPLHTPEEEQSAAEGVASMVDSPFASSLIAPGLMEQLSHSIASSRGETAGTDRPSVNSNPQHGVPQVRSTASGADTAAAGKETSARPCLQGVASILESPFVSACVSHDVVQLQQLNLNGSTADKAAAA
jgi:hypothetical protein